MKRWNFDIPLLITTLLLVGIGLTMVYSSSAVLAENKFGDSFHYVKRMFVFAAAGLGFLWVTTRIHYLRFRRWTYPLLLCAILGMGLVVFSDLGVMVGGASRWIGFGFFRFQPSEFAKILLIFFMAYSMSKKIDRMKFFSIGVVPHLIIGGILMLLVLLQKDLGATVMMGSLVWIMMFAGGSRLIHLGALVVAAIPFVYQLVLAEGYRLQRILSFLDPWKDQYGSGFQVIQSYLAFNEGGFLGKGLGSGQQKLFYLPEAHTDFIFAVIGEEVGFLGILLVIGLFVTFCYRGFRIALRSCDLYGRYLAFGITTLIGLQALINMGVVMGLFPTKGMVLPFISYGGSALVVNLFAVGVLLNISKYEAVVSVRASGFASASTRGLGGWGHGRHGVRRTGQRSPQTI